MLSYSFLKRSCAAFIVMTGLAGCSSIGFMHAMADDVLMSRVSDVLDLSDPDDERHVRSTVDRFFAEATPALAPVYADFLNEQAIRLEQLGSQTSRDDVAEMLAGLRSLLKQSAVDVAPAVASVLVDHTTPERVAHLREALAEQRAERLEERSEGSPDERREERIEQLSDNVERFIPQLNPRQRTAIAAYVDADILEDDDARFFL